MSGCQLITSHGNSRAATQGLKVSVPVALTYLPAGRDYVPCLHNTICLPPRSKHTSILSVICCIFFYTRSPSAPAFIRGSRTQCNAAFLLCWLFSLCLYLHILHSNSSDVQSCTCALTEGGRAGHVDSTGDNTFSSDVAPTSEYIHYPVTRCDLFHT